MNTLISGAFFFLGRFRFGLKILEIIKMENTHLKHRLTSCNKCSFRDNSTCNFHVTHLDEPSSGGARMAPRVAQALEQFSLSLLEWSDLPDLPFPFLRVDADARGFVHADRLMGAAALQITHTRLHLRGWMPAVSQLGEVLKRTGQHRTGTGMGGEKASTEPGGGQSDDQPPRRGRDRRRRRHRSWPRTATGAISI
jgi:hypothetical protein